LKGQRLDWNSLHPRAKEFLFTEGTLQQLSLENAAYARRLIQGGDLSGWHLRSDWKTKVEKSGKSPTKVFSTREKAIWRMVTTASGTASNANGQQVIRTLKNKDFGFGLKEELAQYISTLIDTQEGLCAVTGIPFQYDGEYDDVELLCSLDRIDSAGHYERGNLQIVCRFINKWKSDSSDQTFKRLISLIRSTA
jgi:hypothetical protein